MNLRLDGKIAAAAIKEELKEKFASLLATEWRAETIQLSVTELEF